MSNPLDAIAGAIESGNIMDAIHKSEGTYGEKPPHDADPAKYPQTDLPQATDPAPFVIGPLAK